MLSKCPGSTRILQPQPQEIKCPCCGNEVEIWTDELRTKCPNCKRTVTRKMDLNCLEWCKYAKECVGDRIYQKYMDNKRMEQKRQRKMGKELPRTK